MELSEIVRVVANALANFDATKPRQKKKTFQAGIGPFGEPQLIKNLSELLNQEGYRSRTARTPDLMLGGEEWAVEFKIVRPFGDNGREAENWSVNLLHPYKGNASAIGDAFKLKALQAGNRKAIFVIGYEHQDAKISLDPLLDAFEAIARVRQISLSTRVEEKREGLVHDVHQVLRCVSWEVC